jgi:hypothetical protein
MCSAVVALFRSCGIRLVTGGHYQATRFVFIWSCQSINRRGTYLAAGWVAMAELYSDFILSHGRPMLIWQTYRRIMWLYILTAMALCSAKEYNVIANRYFWNLHVTEVTNVWCSLAVKLHSKDLHVASSSSRENVMVSTMCDRPLQNLTRRSSRLIRRHGFNLHNPHSIRAVYASCNQSKYCGHQTGQINTSVVKICLFLRRPGHGSQVGACSQIFTVTVFRVQSRECDHMVY